MNRTKAKKAVLMLSMIGLVALACSRALTPEESCSFVQNPEQQRVSWAGKLPMKLYIHSSVPTSYYASIDRAVREYNVNLGNGRELIRIMARGTTGEMAPKKDGYSTLYWFNTWDRQRSNEQARTTIYWVGTEIFEADVRVNGADFSYYNGENPNFSGVDLTSLLVHEFGHALGLAHNPSHGSVMYFSLNNGQDRRTLAKADLANLKCEY